MMTATAKRATQRVVARGAQHGAWKGGVMITNQGYRRIRSEDGLTSEFEHRLVVERALGHRLPVRAQIHHVNEDRLDNRPQNLVACEGAAYHKLLHVRQAALDATGDANARRCEICHGYDKPENLWLHPRRTRAIHRACNAKRQRDRRVAA